MKKINRLIAICLTLLMLLSCAPLQGFAEVADFQPSAGEESEDAAPSLPEPVQENTPESKDVNQPADASFVGPLAENQEKEPEHLSASERFRARI